MKQITAKYKQIEKEKTKIRELKKTFNDEAGKFLEMQETLTSPYHWIDGKVQKIVINEEGTADTLAPNWHQGIDYSTNIKLCKARRQDIEMRNVYTQ